MKRTLVAFVAAVLLFCSAGANGADDSIVGTYINKDNTKEYLTLSPNGTFFLKQKTKPYDMERPYVSIEGTYRMEGDKVILQLPDGGEAHGKIQKDAFLDNEGKPWAKQNAPQKTDVDLKPRKKM